MCFCADISRKVFEMICAKVFINGMKKALLTMAGVGLTTTLVFAQQQTVKGTVISSDDGQPVIGATVVVKGQTSIGVATNLDGQFVLNVPKTATMLLVSYVGYKTQEVAIKPNMSITLESDSKALDDVVVVAYGVTKKSAFAGSAASVKADALQNAKVESIDKALAGKVSGLRVSSSTGDAGAAGNIQIRGIGSITGSTAPLFVVDGVAISTGNLGSSGMSSNVLSTINPDDIESMTVLKDAAAASLYGSRAANGVVVITTKKGVQGKTAFNLKLNKGWSTMATNSYQMMNAAQYREYFHDALVGYHLNRQGALLPTGANYGNASVLADAQKYAADDMSQSPVQSDVDGDNWRDQIYDGGYQNEVQFSASGGTDKLRYFGSLGVNDMKGIVATSKFRRYSSLLNVENKAKSWLDLNFKSQISYTDQQGRGDQSGQAQGLASASPLSLLMGALPDAKIYNEDGTYNESASFSANVGNPLKQLSPDYSRYNLTTLRLMNDVGARIKFTDWLSFKTTNSLDYISAKTFRRWSPESLDGESVGGLGSRTNRTVYTLSTSNVLNFNKTFADKHNVDALVGHEAQKYTLQTESFAANTYSNAVLEELANGQPTDAKSWVSGSFLRSFFGSANYNYDSRYYLGASLRQDESSRLGKNKRKGLFYSVSGAWRFGKEKFFANNFIDDAKLRISYGTNGNLPDSFFGAYGLYDFSGSYGDQPASYLTQVENLDLSWEKSRNFNVGLDLNFAKKFSLSLEYFSKFTDDLLLSLPISYGVGVREMDKNVGSISNRGWEFELHGTDILSSKLRWDVDFSLSTLKSRVESLPNGDIIAGDGNLYIYREGEDLNSFYLPTFVGVEAKTGLGQFLIDPDKPATADNLTYYYNLAGRTVQKSAYPKVFGGLTNTFSYQGFTLSTLITYQFGGYLFDYPGYFAENDGLRIMGMNVSAGVAGNYWRQEGDVANNPRPILNNPFRSDRWSTRHLHSTDFVRLKEVSLRYRVPQQLYKRLGISSVDLSLVANNLFFIHAATKDMELEVALNGYRTVDTPQARTISLGLNVGF